MGLAPCAGHGDVAPRPRRSQGPADPALAHPPVAQPPRPERGPRAQPLPGAGASAPLGGDGMTTLLPDVEVRQRAAIDGRTVPVLRHGKEIDTRNEPVL